MRSTDLRIGNYNLFNSKLDRINDGYDIDHVRDDKEGLHKPIPLTEDWLLRLGKGKGNLIINGLHEKGVLYFNPDRHENGINNNVGVKIDDGDDFIEDDFNYKNNFDAAWLSHIIHGEGPEDAEMIISKAVSGLKPKGKIFIHEFIMNNSMDGPLFPALFSINMFLGTDKGQAYSEAQLFTMLKNQGIKDIHRMDFVGPTESGIICGLKK